MQNRLESDHGTAYGQALSSGRFQRGVVRGLWQATPEGEIIGAPHKLRM